MSTSEGSRSQSHLPVEGPVLLGGSPGRRERRHRETRAEIVQAARQIVIEDGVARLTLRKIARRADLAPPALYRYFPGGRADILRAIAVTSLAVLESHLVDLPQDLPPRERIIAMGEAYLRFAREHPAEVALLFDSVSASENMDPTSPDEVFLAPTGVFRLLEIALREGMQDGSFRLGEDDLMLVMHATWALVHGLSAVEQSYEQQGGVLGDRGCDVLRAFVNGLGTDWVRGGVR